MDHSGQDSGQEENGDEESQRADRSGVSSTAGHVRPPSCGLIAHDVASMMTFSAPVSAAWAKVL